MKRRKPKGVSQTTLYRRLRQERVKTHRVEVTLMGARQEITRLLGLTNTLEQQKRDLGSSRRTVEAYYRARAIIAELLSVEKAAISGDLRQDILNALYYGLSRRPVRESVTRGVYNREDSQDLEVKGSEEIG